MTSVCTGGTGSWELEGNTAVDRSKAPSSSATGEQSNISKM